MIEIKHISWTALKHFKRSPKHYLEYLAQKQRIKQGLEKPTEAMILGSAFHCLVLEPEKFNEKFIVSPSFDRRTKDGKEAFATFEKESEGKEILMQPAFENAKNMAEATRFSAKKYIDGLQAVEQELRWQHESGISVLSYVDGIGGDYYVELKSCQDASPVNFQRKAFYDGYIHQVSLYGEGIRRMTAPIPGFVIACESSRPYGVSINKVSEAMQEKYYREVHHFINEFAEWAEEQPAGDYQYWEQFNGYYNWSYDPKK